MSRVVRIDEARSARMSSNKPALEDGYTRIVNAVVEGMAKFPLSQMESRCVWAIVRKTYGFNKTKDRIAASQLAELMSSPEQTITRQKASTVLAGLIRKQVVCREGGSQSAIKINTRVNEWKRPVKATKAPKNPAMNRNRDEETENGSPNRNTVHFPNSKTVHTKDRKDIVSNPSGYLSDSDESHTAPPLGRKPACPYQKIIALYHQILPELPQVQVLSEQRKKQLRARWQSSIGNSPKGECWHLEFWERYFQYVRTCPFLMGQGEASPGRTTFFADLEWLTKASNFIKVIERRYEAKQGEPGNETGRRNSQSKRDAGLVKQQTDLEYAIDNF